VTKCGVGQVEHEIPAFVDSENPTIFQNMIENKWHTFAASRHFFRTIVPYVVFLLFATVSSFYRVAYVWEVHVGPSYGHHESIVYSNTPSMVTTLYPPKSAFVPPK
jgi:hypothetical protein